MTKDKIKKGLECCVKLICDNCPYRNNIHCIGETQQDALNLITEQEQEIEWYKDRLKHLSPCDYKEEVANLGVTCKYEQEIDSLREDNINLKEELYELHDELDIARAEKDKTIKQAKIDVLNELKKKKSITIWDIDEMIEELEQ